uniref:Major outer capsid protein VP7 n=1 Tax=Coho salmon aquareovirus TaxID=57748 RepID=O57124_9REOV|nr:major outer capsid protein VP7 [Coho salmon aquareovirus]
MDTKPLHTTVANALCDALISGHLLLAKIGGTWSTDIRSPDLLSTGQYQLCALCLKQVCSYHVTEPCYYPHECHHGQATRNVGQRLSENLLTMSHAIRRSVSDAVLAMRGQEETSLLNALSGAAVGYSPEYSFSELAATMTRVRKGVTARAISLDALSCPINEKRALTFYGKDLSQHPLVCGTPLASPLETATGANSARLVETKKILVQVSGMPVPVVFDPEGEHIYPVLSSSNRAIILHALLSHSCAQVTANQASACMAPQRRSPAAGRSFRESSWFQPLHSWVCRRVRECGS